MSSSSTNSNMSSSSSSSKEEINHPSPAPALIAHQRGIYSNKDIQSSYLSNDRYSKDEISDNEDGNESSTHASESESDDEPACKVVIPRKKKRNSDSTSSELLAQLINQHKEYAKIQKKMYSIQTELAKEEITNRYTKLELNTSEVRVAELRTRISDTKKELTRVESLNTELKNGIVSLKKREVVLKILAYTNVITIVSVVMSKILMSYFMH